jgi:hypothetical protein
LSGTVAMIRLVSRTESDQVKPWSWCRVMRWLSPPIRFIKGATTAQSR